MANASRARKRIFAPLRSPDGSAFQKCEDCGVLVAIALFDMHDCGRKGGVKRIRGGTEPLSVCDQPRSPFCCFMESFKKRYEAKNWIEIDRKAFETWKNMPEKERYPYVVQARKVNSAYDKILYEESCSVLEEDDEADSVVVGKFDPAYKVSPYWSGFEGSDWSNSFEW